MAVRKVSMNDYVNSVLEEDREVRRMLSPEDKVRKVVDEAELSEDVEGTEDDFYVDFDDEALDEGFDESELFIDEEEDEDELDVDFDDGEVDEELFDGADVFGDDVEELVEDDLI